MSQEPTLPELLATAERAARAAGEHALQNRHRRHEVDARYPHDVKLRLDVECQEQATEVLEEEWPTFSVFGEEGGTEPEAGDPHWVVDPIDGTVNFLHGLPFWCSSIAFRQGGESRVGVVYLPEMRRLYVATENQASTCNGEPIRVSETNTLADSLVVTGISKHVENKEAFLFVYEVARNVQKIRVTGSAAMDICLVACGEADGYYESSIYLWDWAAAGLIARQAGGQAEVLDPGPGHQSRYLCTNGHIHQALKRVVT